VTRDPESGPPSSADAPHTEYLGSRRERAWSVENPGNLAIRDALLRRLLAAADVELKGPGRILDIGCGAGWWLARLREFGVGTTRLYGLDLLEARVDTARSLLPGAELTVGDARELPYADEEFSLVYLITVLSDLPTKADADRALQEAVRVLAPRGLLLCYEPAVPNPLNPHTRPILKPTLTRGLGTGWTSERLTVLPQLARRLGSRTARLYPVLERIRPLLTHRLVHYRK
jgi:ubiquinone/menaquinone biosynthesis C-methylase UbiE